MSETPEVRQVGPQDRPFYQVQINGKTATVVPLDALPWAVRSALEGLSRDRWRNLQAVHCGPTESLVMAALARSFDGIYRDLDAPKSVFVTSDRAGLVGADTALAEQEARDALRKLIATVSRLARARGSRRGTEAIKLIPSAYRPKDPDKAVAGATRRAERATRNRDRLAERLAAQPQGNDQAATTGAKGEPAPAQEVAAAAVAQADADDPFDGIDQ